MYIFHRFEKNVKKIREGGGECQTTYFAKTSKNEFCTNEQNSILLT